MKHPPCCRSLRRLLLRLGFDSPSIKNAADVPGMYVVTAYDPVECRNFCRSYTVEDIQCICRCFDIFWRYIK